MGQTLHTLRPRGMWDVVILAVGQPKPTESKTWYPHGKRRNIPWIFGLPSHTEGSHHATTTLMSTVDGYHEFYERFDE